MPLKVIIKFLLLNESPFGGHLWYLTLIEYMLLEPIINTPGSNIA